MKRVLVFGTGTGWQKIKNLLDYKKICIEAFVDNNKSKVGKILEGKKIVSPYEIANYQYDFILIASQFYEEITKQLLDLKVSSDKIIPFYKRASIFLYNWIEYINPDCYRFIEKMINDAEFEMARSFRNRESGRLKKILEEYKKLNIKSEIVFLLELLIAVEENQKETAEKRITQKLNKEGLAFSYTVTPNTRIRFEQEAVSSIISVIIPVYKDVEGLKDTLDSLKNQTIGKDKYEIIVVNDGGEPTISDLCRSYQVSFIEYKPNKGSYYARNKGLEISKGEYLAFVDADIVVPPDWLEKGLRGLKEYDYVVGDIKIDDKKVKNLTNYYELKTAFPVDKYFEGAHFGPTANLFIKRKVVEEIGGFDRRFQSGGDREFGERVYRFTDFKMAYCKDLFVIHPPRDYRELLKKMVRVNKGLKDLYVFYPERFESPKIKFTDVLKEAIKPPYNVVYDQNYPFRRTMVFLYFWWIKLVVKYKRWRWTRL